MGTQSRRCEITVKSQVINTDKRELIARILGLLNHMSKIPHRFPSVEKSLEPWYKRQCSNTPHNSTLFYTISHSFTLSYTLSHAAFTHPHAAGPIRTSTPTVLTVNHTFTLDQRVYSSLTMPTLALALYVYTCICVSVYVTVYTIATCVYVYVYVYTCIVVVYIAYTAQRGLCVFWVLTL